MSAENIAYLLLGASLASLMRNVWDYRFNTRHVNHDAMGAAINWHLGFAWSWLLFCTALIVLPSVHWLVGVAAIPGLLLAAWVFLLPIHYSLEVLGRRKQN